MGKLFKSMILILMIFEVSAQSQPGSIKGQVYEIHNGQRNGIPSATIKLFDQANNHLKNLNTDFDGNFSISPLAAGKYNLEIHSLGSKTQAVKGIIVKPGKATLYDIEIVPESSELGTVDIIFKRKLVEANEEGYEMDAQELDEAPIRTIDQVAVLSPDATPTAGGGISIKGERPEATGYIVDGMKFNRPPNIPQKAIKSVSVNSSGLAAIYGDVQGGIVNTQTRGPSPIWFGNAEVLSSSLFDNYGYNLAAFTIGGPLLQDEKKGTLISFMLSTEYERNEEPAPSSVPYVGIDRNYLKDLENTPLQINPNGRTVFYRSEFSTEDQLSDIDRRRNSSTNQLRMIGNLNFRTSRLTSLTLGGRLELNRGKQANNFNHIFNYKTNLNRQTTDWTARARFLQSFAKDSTKESLFKNAYYTIQVDYTRYSGKTEDSRYGEDFFKYGHIGEFEVLTEASYAYGQDSVTGYSGFIYNGERPTGIEFRQGKSNTLRGNYTQNYFDLMEEYQGLEVGTIEELIGNNIPVNGTGPRSVYGLWGSPGGIQGNFSKFQQNQFRITAMTSFEYKKHAIIAGFEVEQKSNRFYSLDATGLWTQMRLLQNLPNRELDLANPIVVRDANGVYQDTINYNYAYSPNNASAFAENVRIANGLDPYNTDQINIMNMDPGLFKLDFFSADELINPGGNTYVNYYGYDYTGNITDQQTKISDFFTTRDENGNFSRPVAAFEPTYVAGYIQDQFEFRELSFNVGIRVDRFDLNQEVLKDPFVLFPTYKVRDLANSELPSDVLSQIPANVGGDYVVYVSSFDYGSSTIVGFRNPENNQWFDANGDLLTDPQDLSDAAGGGIKPMLLSPPSEDSQALDQLNGDSFQDYDPQVVVMPRISFNFPINENALFVAHYDVLSQRPTTGVSRLDPFDYLNLLNKDGSGILNNPNLKPQITTEYELGFKQKLTESSALKISAYYRELRDLVQTRAFTQAYPITYIAYDNLDFATTKGLTLEYELRRVQNFRMRGNYTLKFASGTGSNINSGAALANSGQPNLRYILPLDFERRHEFTVNMDYRVPNGKGPTWWDVRVFENVGLNLLVTGLSGNPYTKRVDFRDNAQIDGQVNGARLPWQMTFDAKLNKFFPLSKNKSFEVYFQVFNLFDTQNITGVYAFTGSPDDNGYLSSSAAQAQITQQASARSYVDLYNRAINNSGFYGLPRRIRLGLSYNF
tara:strand:- start:13496 stop:17113 length:3618 start_codon:yes stop_codon:yes gene_type:complete